MPKLHALIAKAKREGWYKWIRSAADERAVVEGGCRFDERAAAWVDEFFRRYLRHSKGKFAGKTFELIGWQLNDIIAPLFGWKRDDGTRRYRIAYVELPKKNGKSTLSSGIGLYMLVADNEAGAEVYSAATDKDQASIVHNEAINMVHSSPDLSAILKVNHSTRNIAYPAKAAYYRALSAETDNKEGLNAHCIIGDELHVWHGRDLWNALEYAGAARSQPLRFFITTAGDDVSTVCYEQHGYAEDLIRGTVYNEQYFSYVRAAEQDDDVDDPAVWRKANPSLGITMSERDFRADAESAKKSAATLASWKRYRLNVWTTSTNPWLNLDDWAACKAAFTQENLRGHSCFGGIDLGMVDDMSAYGLVFPDGADAYVLPFFWLPESAAQPGASINANQYRIWADAGLLKLTDGNTVDFEVIENDIAALKSEFKIIETAYDPWHAAQLAQRLQDKHSMKVFEFRQTLANYSPPTARFEKLVIGKNLKHNGHPVLTWQAGNVQVKTDANQNMRPVKPSKDSPKKIDGIVALIMALGRSTESPPKTSVYETRGVISFA